MTLLSDQGTTVQGDCFLTCKHSQKHQFLPFLTSNNGTYSANGSVKVHSWWLWSSITNWGIYLLVRSVGAKIATEVAI